METVMQEDNFSVLCANTLKLTDGHFYRSSLCNDV